MTNTIHTLRRDRQLRDIGRAAVAIVEQCCSSESCEVARQCCQTRCEGACSAPQATLDRLVDEFLDEEGG